MMIEAEHLFKRYGTRLVVDDLSLHVNVGDVLGFIGPNGAGKTTTMKMISGVMPPYAGRVRIDGIDIEAEPRLAKARIVILLNGIVALLLALVFTDIIGTLLLALAVYAGAFTVPVLWGLLGLKAKPKFVASAIVAGGALALAGKLCPPLPGSLGAHTGDFLMVAAFIVNAIILAFGREKK